MVRLPKGRLSSAVDGTLYGKDLETLRRLGLWVDDPAEERVEMIRKVEHTNTLSHHFRATVVLTLDCNLACPYCYEGNFRGRLAMDDETSTLLKDTVIRERIEKGQDVEIRFYGGEPLMALPRLKEIARSLGEAARAYGTKFSFSMVTNGTLLTRKVVEELLPLGFTAAQFTLDGPPEIHDLQRPFISGAGSFAVTVKNLKEICDLITIHPGGNFTEDNYRDFPRMLDCLLEAGIAPENLGPVHFAPVLPPSGRNRGHGVNCITGDEPWLCEATLFLREETLRRGFAVKKVAMGICPIEMENELVVNYDGTLYKCPVLMGWPELVIGTLRDGIGDYRESHSVGLWKKEECLDCAYLPLCFGGCRALPLLRNGAIGIDCRKEFYDATLQEIILQDLRYRPSRPEPGTGD